ncbi:MAG TPA: PadR family transcriptional regulator [Kofleriaceae bacterium]|nr:PadR family transcriptional regulator [Kofleriaceae bacterium]
MSSTTRLLVLGVVRIFQPVHGYEVRRELITWRAQEWASVQPGSIYNALKTLTRDGFLEVVGTDQVGGRPERTSYRLTSAGEEEFRILLREEWWTVRTPIDPLMAAISFIGYVSRAEAIAALEHRMNQIHGMVHGIEFGIESHDGIDSPFHVREMMRLLNARVLSEVEWAKQFIARLKNGEYTTADDPPWEPASAAERQAATKPSQKVFGAGEPVRRARSGGGVDARRAREDRRSPADRPDNRRRSPADRPDDRRRSPAINRSPGAEPLGPTMSEAQPRRGRGVVSSARAARQRRSR